MSPSTLSIKRPVLTIVMNLTIVLFVWIIGYSYLGSSSLPLTLGVHPDKLYRLAILLSLKSGTTLEKAINSIDGIRNITSSSLHKSSSITVEFNLNKDFQEPQTNA
jgi:HAE1 family hydrophobic/amphiphilic exporter-1/multidrug efflux pump